MSRRWILGCLMAALMLVIVASVAYAARVQCSPNNATCTGTEEADTIYGTLEPDLIYGLGGDDYIFTNAGQDTVFGNTGNDDIWGEAGSDTLRGNRGNDRLRDREGAPDVDHSLAGGTTISWPLKTVTTWTRSTADLAASTRSSTPMRAT